MEIHTCVVPNDSLQVMPSQFMRNFDGFVRMQTLALVAVIVCVIVPCAASTRHYYIAAEDVTWDFAPSGRDLIHGGIIPRPWTSQTKWPKTRYIEYTDSTFSTLKPQAEWLGILGPIIRAEVGDAIVGEFINLNQLSHSLHTHCLW